jgi:hypothetical protein
MHITTQCKFQIETDGSLKNIGREIYYITSATKEFYKNLTFSHSVSLLGKIKVPKTARKPKICY